MAKFVVIGAERESGESVRVEIEAETVAAAERVANSRDILVLRVLPGTLESAEFPAVPGAEATPVEWPRKKPRNARKRRRIPLFVSIMLGIGGGVLLASTVRGLFDMVLLAWSTDLGSGVVGAGGPTPPYGISVTQREAISQDALTIGPTEAGDGPSGGVEIRESRLDFGIDRGVGDTLRVAWVLRVSNTTGVTKTVRIAPALIDQAGDEIWRADRGYVLRVPPGRWTFRDAMTVTVRAPFGNVVDAYYRW